MFKTEIINDKHFIKNNNLLIKSTFYTTPTLKFLLFKPFRLVERPIYSFPPISSGAIRIEFSSEFIFGTYGVSLEFGIVRYEQMGQRLEIRVESKSVWNQNPCGIKIRVESKSVWNQNPCGIKIRVENGQRLNSHVNQNQ